MDYMKGFWVIPNFDKGKTKRFSLVSRLDKETPKPNKQPLKPNKKPPQLNRKPSIIPYKEAPQVDE